MSLVTSTAPDRYEEELARRLCAAQCEGVTTRTYDLVMTHKLDADDYFIHCVQRQCAEARLNFFLIEPLWVEPFHEALKTGKVWPRALLNMHSEHHQPEEIYH